MNVSRILAGIILVTHLGAIVLVALVPVAWTVRLLLWGVIGWSCYFCLQTQAWRRGPVAIQAIELDSEGEVSVRLAGSDAWQPARIRSSYVHPWLTLLSLKLESRRWPVNLAIAADAVEPEPFRRWRVALKLRTAEA